MGSGRRLRHSIRKYGEECHVKEILQFFESREDLVKAEKKAITEEMLCDVKCMNLMSGGTGGFISVEHMKKVLDKKNWLWQNDTNWATNYSQQMSKNATGNKSWTNKKHSGESKIKMSEARKGIGVGETNSQFGTMWITNGTENKKVKKNEMIPEGWYKGRK
jgi:hypothetical protein